MRTQCYLCHLWFDDAVETRNVNIENAVTFLFETK